MIYLGYVQIAEFRFELISDMTVIPQQFTLNCVTVGSNSYIIALYCGSPQFPQISRSECGDHDSMINCYQQLVHSSNNTYNNNLTITWDTEIISSGSFNQSCHQEYRCQVVNGDVDRNIYLTVKGINCYDMLNIII